MPTVNVDTSEAQTFEPLPKGAYSLIISKCIPVTSKAGNPSLDWEFTVDEGEFIGRKLFKTTPTNGRGVGFTTDILKALNMEAKTKKFGFNTEDAIGESLVGIVDLNEYEGTIHNEITKFLSG